MNLDRYTAEEIGAHEQQLLARVPPTLRETSLPDEIGQPCVPTRVALRFELGVQRTCRTPLAPRPVGVGLQRLGQRRSEWCELGRRLTASVFRLRARRRSQPPLDRVARQTRQPGDLADRLLVAEVHAANLAQSRPW